MKQICAKVACFLWAFCLATGTAAFAAETLRADQIAAIDAAVRQAMKEQQTPSVVIVVNRGGERIFARAWGSRNVADDLPAQVDTLYQYGSITKQFTAMCIFLLAQDGKLSLDDPISKYLPAFAKLPVSIRELLIHTSGMADFTDEASSRYEREIAPQIGVDADWGLKWASEAAPDFAPGAKAKYSNSGYVALARIVERVSGQSFADFLQQRIFLPVKMNNVREYQYLSVVPNLAKGYVVWSDEFSKMMGGAMAGQGAAPGRLVNAPIWNLRQVDGAGYLVGDADDLQAWDDALMAGTLLQGKWREMYFSPGALKDGTPAYVGAENKMASRPAYCNGGLAKVVLGKHTVFGANGGTFGFSTFTATVPDMHLSVTMLSNLGSADNSKISTPLMEALMNE
jgi:D-alanyl-D-alanine carboxypeptidase